jgi:localization factor PodJL
MKSGGPWNLRGLRPEAREAARTAARRSGISVGEWLNNVIEPDDELDDEEPALFTDFYEDPEVKEPEAEEEEPPRYARRDNREQHRPPTPRRERREEQKRDFDRESDDRRIAEEAPRHTRRDDREPRRPADSRREKREERKREFDHESAHTHVALNKVHNRLDKLSQQLERMSHNEAAARQKQSRPPQAERDRNRPSSQERRGPSQGEAGQTSRLTGAPSRFRPSGKMASSIDDAVAEIAARQRALDSGEEVESTLLPTAPQTEPTSAPVTAAPASTPVSAPAFLSAAVSEPTINLANLDLQLRHITERIEALRPSNELENSIKGIRSDLSEIAQLITGALPRRAVESLEIEVKALAERIEHSRQFGVDTTAIAGLERGLNEIRDALHTLKPAESLVGFDDAVKELSQKVDLIVAKEDPAALQQLETAIGALRGIVSHVASNETLTKVAEDVRALAAKVDTLAGSAASNQSLSALESRIEILTNALTASADAGQAVPRELEKLLTGLIEKLEWVQLTHTDHAALAHLEDRIATLVQRFDASETRFGHLEAVERGITDLLVHIEDIRGIAGKDATSNVPVAFERDVAEIKQSEQRTQDSLEAVQGTVEQVVDRLAMIESGIRESVSRPAPVPPAPMTSAPCRQHPCRQRRN